MNTTMANIIDENICKFNYFKLLASKNKINLSMDIIEAQIKPKLDKDISVLYFLNNILNIVLIKKLLFNFSRNVRDIKYNKMLNKFEKTFLDEIKEALDKTKISIPRNYDNYYINTLFNNNYLYCIARHLLACCSKTATEYMTPIKYKKYILEKVKEFVSNQQDCYIINCLIASINSFIMIVISKCTIRTYLSC